MTDCVWRYAQLFSPFKTVDATIYYYFVLVRLWMQLQYLMLLCPCEMVDAAIYCYFVLVRRWMQLSTVTLSL